MSLREIPIIDVGGLFGNDVENEQNIIEQIQYACKNYGFFYISNHHIDQNLIKEFRESIKNFFKLPKEIKNLCRRTRMNSRGYYDEELTKTVLDWKEVAAMIGVCGCWLVVVVFVVVVEGVTFDDEETDGD